MNLQELAKNFSFSIDSRTLQPGEVFVALKGPNFDGHRFLLDAEQRGAVAAVVEEEVKKSAIPCIKVENTSTAFAELATIRRHYFRTPIVALTGSCGKTTTRTIIKTILQFCGNVLETQENLNNNIGVPLTLLRLSKEHKFAVIEIGASEKGEIEFSTNIVQPDVALITNAAPVHLDGFGGIDGVASEKGKILSGLSESGVAVLNADDSYFDYWRTSLGKQRVLTFGLENRADFFAENMRNIGPSEISFELNSPLETELVTLRLHGKHNVMNALAAAAAAYALGAPLAAIKKGIQTVRPVDKRMIKQQGICDSTIINDTYNANPFSMKAALKVLAQYKGKKIFVIGDMAELGKNPELYHHQLGLDAKKYGVDILFAIGELTPLTVKAFGKNGYHFADRFELIEALKKILTFETTALIKGSKINKLWEVASALLENIKE